MLSRLPGGLSDRADAALLLSLADTVLTETTLPLASVTVVVTEPSALVVTLVVSLEDELPPDADEAEEPALDEVALAALADGLLADAIARVGMADETEPMLPLMV